MYLYDDITIDNINDMFDMYIEEIERTAPKVNTVSSTNTTGKDDKSIGLLQKACNLVVSIIDKIISSITELIARVFMSKGDRKNFKQYKEMIEADPTIKDKKVTVKDYRNYMKSLDSTINEAEKAANKLHNENNNSSDNTNNNSTFGFIDDLMERGKNILKTTAKSVAGAGAGAVTAISIESALRMAESDVNTAKTINTALKADRNIMRSIENAIGFKKAAKFEKQMEGLSKEVGLRRLIANLKGRKVETIDEAVSDTLNSINKAVDGHRLRSNMSNQDVKTIRNAAIKHGGKFAVKQGAEKVARVAQNTVERVAKKVTGNQNIKETNTSNSIEQIIGNVKEFTNNFKKQKSVSMDVDAIKSRQKTLIDDTVFFEQRMKDETDPNKRAQLRSIISVLSGEVSNMQSVISSATKNNNEKTTYYNKTVAEELAERGRRDYD